MKKLVLAALAVLILPLFAMAQISISGKVSEKTNGTALAGATVKVNRQLTTTDRDGRYNIALPSGTYEITVTYVGYQPAKQTVTLSANQNVDFTLLPSVFVAEEVVVSATRAASNAATTFKNVDKATLEKNNFGQDLPFLLDNTPGVVVTSDAGAGVGYTGIRIRGSDATRVNITINGIPYNDSESQGTFWVNMPDFASSVDNIQIQRGVGTSSNGAGAFGGSLNIQTTKIESQPFALLNNSYGSFNTLKNTVVLGSGLINNKFSFEGRLSRIKSDGYIDRASSDLKSYFLSGSYQGASSSLKLNVFAGNETTYQAWNGIPESKLNGDAAGIDAYIIRNELNPADAAALKSSGNRTYNSFNYKDQTDNYWQTHYQLIYATQLSQSLTFNGALHYTYGKGYYEEFKAAQKLTAYGLTPVVIGTTTITRTDLVRRRWLDNDFYGVTYGLNYNPEKSIGLTLGGAYNRYVGDHFGQVIYAQYGSNGNNDRHYYDNTGEKNDFNLFGKATLSLMDGLNFYTDLQYRSVRYKVNGTEKNLNTLALNDKLNFFNPKFGVSLNLNQRHNLYASFGVANKEPNRDDYINVPTGVLPTPERLNNVEAGYRFGGSGLNLGVNGYGMFYRDQLVITGKINDVGEYFRQNTPSSYRAGIEVDAAYEINPQLMLALNAAFSKNKIKNFTEFTDDYDNGGQAEVTYNNTDISFSPNVVAGGELTYKPFSGFGIGLQGKFVDSQYLDNTSNANRKLDSYWVSNVRLGYDLPLKGIKNASIGLLVNNIFNKRYESNGYTFGYYSGGSLTTENFYFPQAGTNFLLNLNLKF